MSKNIQINTQDAVLDQSIPCTHDISTEQLLEQDFAAEIAVLQSEMVTPRPACVANLLEKIKNIK